MRKLLLAALVLCLAGHIYLALGLGLSVDEAHYALYAAHPALSYFDHPPLVGWVQIPFVWLADVLNSVNGVMHIVPLALWLVTIWALWHLSIPALILFLLSPLHHLLGLALVPDSILLPLTLWTMVLTWKVSAEPSKQGLWLWLGVALGLAGLAKYTGVFLALGAAIFLLSQHGLQVLKTRGLWLAVLIAALMITPVLVWNAQHDWLSFRYQLGHAGGNGNAWELKQFLRHGLVQLVTYGLLPLLGCLVFLVRLRRHHTNLMRLCLAFGLPMLLLMLYLAGKGAALPHWTAGAWLSLLPLAAMGFQHFWQSGAGYARWAARALVCGLCLLQAVGIVVLGVMMATGGQWQGQALFGERGNPFADLHGWQAASVRAQVLAQSHKTDAILVSNWTLASRLAWYARPARVLTLDSKNKQFEIWHGKLKSGDSVIWANWSQMPFDAPVAPSLFARCELIPAAESARHASPSLSTFSFHLCHNWQGKP